VCGKKHKSISGKKKTVAVFRKGLVGARTGLIWLKIERGVGHL
jgi:hypothetical protein